MEQVVMEQNRTKRGTESREAEMRPKRWIDRKSTRLNSSH